MATQQAEIKLLAFLHSESNGRFTDSGRKAVDAIATKLNLSRNYTGIIISSLRSQGFIKTDGRRGYGTSFIEITDLGASHLVHFATKNSGAATSTTTPSDDEGSVDPTATPPKDEAEVKSDNFYLGMGPISRPSYDDLMQALDVAETRRVSDEAEIRNLKDELAIEQERSHTLRTALASLRASQVSRPLQQQ